ncbi:MAG: ATP-dependent zinc metalloprotease FtsH [Planctomycetota bacterium]
MKPRKDSDPTKRPKSRPFGSIAFVIIFLLLIVISIFKPWSGGVDNQKLTTTQFLEKLYTGEVAQFTVEPEGEIRGTFVNNNAKVKDSTVKKETPGGLFGLAGRSEDAPKTFHLYSLTSRENAFALQKRIRRLDSNPAEAKPLIDKIKSGQVLATSAVLLTKTDESGGKKTRLFLDLVENSNQKYVEVIASKPDANTTDVAFGISEVLASLKSASVPVEVMTLDGAIDENAPNALFITLISVFGPWILILIVLWLLIGRQMRSSGGGGGILGFGRSRAVLYTKENRTNVTFDDVAGIDEAKEEVKEVIEFLKNPQRFSRLGGRIPRGILLVGPPGTGKTLLAKAIAGEAEVPFFSISGSDFVEMFVGVGASRVRDLFKQAKENAPCIIFLDEIDAVGRKRGSGFSGGHDEREQTLNAILVEMDGFDTNEGIIVIASTNRPDVLDPALLRPGRFDREVVIDLPDVKGREEILKVHSRRVKISTEVDIQTIARATPMFSGADLAALMNEAAIIAVLKKRDAVAQEDLEEARDKIRFGRQKKSRVMKEEDKLTIARHESGHALVALLTEGAEPVHKVTIIPRGMAGGATMFLPEQDRMGYSRAEANANLCVDYGGRIAEELLGGDISTGAASDIAHATRTARMMVCEWGFSTKIGPVNYGERQGSEFLGSEFSAGRFHSEGTAREIDEEVQRICSEAYERAKKLLVDHRADLDRITQALLQYETITGAELKLILQGHAIESLRPAVPPVAPSSAAPTKPRVESRPQLESFGDAGLAPA